MLGWGTSNMRLTKPKSFADCVGDELPLGWEEIVDPNVGTYFINHLNQTTQLEDPRLQWRRQQEQMLKEYLVTANEDLAAKKEIYTVKEQRLILAQDEYHHLHNTLAGWKSSRTSLNSNSSVGSTKYDPDLLKSDVALAKNRVARLKQELEQIRAEMHYKEKGVETLTRVDQKMAGDQEVYNIHTARSMLDKIRTIQKSLSTGEKEKQDLMQRLAKLKDDILTNKLQGGSSPDVSLLSLPREVNNTASQTDLTGEGLPSGARLAEIARMRFLYDEAKKKVNSLSLQLAGIEEEVIPGQTESDKDHLLLIQEKEQLMRELRSINVKGRGEEEIHGIELQICQLERDLNMAMEVSSKQIANRLKLQDRKSTTKRKLDEAIKLASYLESQLRSLSLSTLSASSGSSLGSLGSLSASSRGSLNSLNFADIYGHTLSSEANLQDLNRIYNLLQGHSISPIIEMQATGSSDNINLQSSYTRAIGEFRPSLIGNASVTGSNPSLMSQIGGAGVTGSNPSLMSQIGGASVTGSNTSLMSPMSSSLSSLSPPISPYDIGPPPSYEQHMIHRHAPQIAQDSDDQNVENIQERFSQIQSITDRAPNPVSATEVAIPGTSSEIQVPQPSHSETLDSFSQSSVLRSRFIGADNSETVVNAPLSPISEDSSGVCNNSGGNTRSVSAAVSDESVAGDSGVFEASIKRPSDLDDVLEMNLESAQVQIGLKFDRLESKLLISIEQARNLAALAFAERSKVCIKAALLPSSPGVSASLVTSLSKNLDNPKFNQVFRVPVPENKLFHKILQVNIWCVREPALEECLGSVQVSLADFEPKLVSQRWYNVLSFRFMEAESTLRRKERVSTSSEKESIDSQPEKKPNEIKSEEGGNCPDSPGLATSESERQKETRLHPIVASLREESSDESTVISSGTSTLTRNQGLEEMGQHFDINSDDEDDISSSSSEDDDDFDEGQDSQDALDSPPQTPVIPEIPKDTVEEKEESVLCDAETNTEGEFRGWERKRSEDTMRASAIRRSQTFSPPGGRLEGDYRCKLNRHGSDSSVPLYRRGPFQRNAVERRSLRWKKTPSAIPPPQQHTPKDHGKVRTSLDLELDLQASKAKLSHLQDEITRLRDLVEMMKDTKTKGEGELPGWFTDNEKLQELLNEAERLQKKQVIGDEQGVYQKKIVKLLRRVSKEVHRFQRRNGQKKDERLFREKMAFFTTVNMSIPVILKEGDEETQVSQDMEPQVSQDTEPPRVTRDTEPPVSHDTQLEDHG